VSHLALIIGVVFYKLLSTMTIFESTHKMNEYRHKTTTHIHTRKRQKEIE